VIVGTETCDVHFCNIQDCIQALLNNATLTEHMVFAPEKHYTDESKTTQMYHDMYASKWWWATQKAVEKNLPGATIVPVIISTDKTQLTLFWNKNLPDNR
jgi:Plavaka transposase